MKKKFIKSLAVGTVLMAASAVQAGTLANNNVNYAVEALATSGANSNITASNVEYTMGVNRTEAQEFVIIYTLPTGITFNATPAAPVSTNALAVTVSLKRGGIGESEVVYAVDVTALDQVDVDDIFTLTTGQINAAGSVLQTVGGQVTMTVALKDVGETSYVDNTGPISTTLATGARASDFWDTTAGPAANGVALDWDNTTVDANATVPMAGFLATVAGDTATTATAVVQVKNTTAGVANLLNLADYVLVAADTVTVTITDQDGSGFEGLATNGLCFDLDNDAVCDAGEIFTINGNVATLALAGNNANFGADRNIIYTSDAITPMGVDRKYTIAGTITPSVDTTNVINYTAPGGIWWDWTSNGTILQATYAQAPLGWTCRTVLSNTSSNDATFTIEVIGEPGSNLAGGTTVEGTIPADSIWADECENIFDRSAWTGTGSPRGTVIFTINAPSTSVQGTYQLAHPAGTGLTTVQMVRPNTN